MVIDYIVGSAAAARTWTAGTNQTERLDEASGAYSSSAVSTQLGVNGGAMGQTASASLTYGLIHFALRIPGLGAAGTSPEFIINKRRFQGTRPRYENLLEH